MSPLGAMTCDPQPLPQPLIQTLRAGNTGAGKGGGLSLRSPQALQSHLLPGNRVSYILHHLALSEPLPCNMQTGQPNESEESGNFYDLNKGDRYLNEDGRGWGGMA